MSIRAARWVVWAALVLLVPLPFFLAQTGAVPAARLLMLGGVMLAVIAAEGARGMVGVAAALLLAQAVIYVALLWAAAALLVRALRPLSRRAVAAATLALVCVALAVAASRPLYCDPFRAHALRTTVLHVYE